MAEFKGISLPLLWLVALLLPLASALMEEKFVTFSGSNSSIGIHKAAIIYDADDPKTVHIAANALVSDFNEITGTKPANISWTKKTKSLGRDGKENAIIIGTVESDLVGRLVDDDKIDVSDIKGKWETFKTAVVDDPLPGVNSALLIVGSDKKAAAFGVYTLAEQCGQSPYHFWTDVPPTKRDAIYAIRKTTVHGEPTVKYRGLFINDEAPALMGWWAKYNEKTYEPLNSEFYTHVFDMMARLKANFIWPGSWKSFIPAPGNIFFTDDPKNIGLANDYGFTVSTSHQEPMQRSTNEWNETSMGPWDWSQNKENITKFMEGGVRRAGMNDTYYTIGMRSNADGPIAGDDPLKILQDIFDTEREMLKNEYGKATDAKQLWAIYKEVATYYAAGLTPPDDVTLMFTDDNWGNIQRLPWANETERSGGVGLYFHLEYTGGPKAYKWHNTNNLAKVYKELYHALERGADRIWVINVADIKPMEFPYNMIMDLAWNGTVVDFDTIPDWVHAFAEREFGGGSFGKDDVDEIADILLEQSRLIGRRKFEATQKDTYSILNYRENERVQAEWKSLSDRVSKIENSLANDDPHQTAIFHYLGYPIHAGHLYHSIVLGTGLNNQWGRERRNDANGLSVKVLADFDSDFDLLEKYDTVEDGKWAGVMAQPKHDEFHTPQSIGDDWWEPTTDAVVGLWYVQLRQNATVPLGSLGIYVDGSVSAQLQGRSLPSAVGGGPTDGNESPQMPTFSPYGPEKQSIDIFHRGDYRVPITWSIEPPESWIILNGTKGVTKGTVDQHVGHQRVDVSIDWNSAPKDFNETVEMRVSYDTPPYFDNVHLPIVAKRAPSDFEGFPSDGGLVSIEGPHYQRSSGGGKGNDVGFARMPYLGTRTESGSIALRPYKEARKDEDKAKEAYVEYDFYTFRHAGPLNATIYLTSGLDTDPKLLMSYSLLLDGKPQNSSAEWERVLNDPEEAGSTPLEWMNTVADQVWKNNATFGSVDEGKHTLRWKVNSPEIYLEKIVLNGGVILPTTYLGVPETVMVGGNSSKTRDTQSMKELI